MTVVRTRTPSGEAIVILPEAEFEHLRELAEDATDARLIEASRSALAAGEEELLSTAEIDALRDAATPLAFWRRKRRLSEAALAQRSGIDEGTLSAVERGERMADIHLYLRLARILGVTVEDLVSEPDAA